MMSQAVKGLKDLEQVSKRLAYVKIFLFPDSILNIMAWKEHCVLTCSSL